MDFILIELRRKFLKEKQNEKKTNRARNKKAKRVAWLFFWH